MESMHSNNSNNKMILLYVIVDTHLLIEFTGHVSEPLQHRSVHVVRRTLGHHLRRRRTVA